MVLIKKRWNYKLRERLLNSRMRFVHRLVQYFTIYMIIRILCFTYRVQFILLFFNVSPIWEFAFFTLVVQGGNNEDSSRSLTFFQKIRSFDYVIWKYHVCKKILMFLNDSIFGSQSLNFPKKLVFISHNKGWILQTKNGLI